jgi:hypothetical protein
MQLQNNIHKAPQPKSEQNTTLVKDKSKLMDNIKENKDVRIHGKQKTNKNPHLNQQVAIVL